MIKCTITVVEVSAGISVSMEIEKQEETISERDAASIIDVSIESAFCVLRAMAGPGSKYARGKKEAEALQASVRKKMN